MHPGVVMKIALMVQLDAWGQKSQLDGVNGLGRAQTKGNRPVFFFLFILLFVEFLSSPAPTSSHSGNLGMLYTDAYSPPPPLSLEAGRMWKIKADKGRFDG